VSLAVLAVIFASTLWDYSREYRQGIRAVRAALEEQAHALRLARDALGPDAFAAYVDAFCARMNESISPGHHILVLGPDGGTLANSHRHSGAAMASALRASDAAEPVIAVGDHRAAQVRLADDDGTVIIVAQYLDHVREVLRRQLVRRLVTAGVAAGVLILLVVGSMSRWVLRPLGLLRRAAARWGRRDFAARAEPAGPDDLRVLAAEFNAMAAELEGHERARRAELERARAIQESLLPRRIPRVPGLGLAAAYRPAAHVAGDLYDIVPLDADRTAVAVLDVAGHGISAALLTGVVKMSLYHRLSQEADLGRAVSLVNADLLGCRAVGRFVTLCVGVWDRRARTWTYCAAGHPGGLLRTPAGTQALDSTGPLLGVVAREAPWPVEARGLEPDDLLVLYSDGVTEAGSPAASLGKEGLLGLVDAYDGAWDGLPARILAEVDAREPAGPSDDVTVVVLRAAEAERPAGGNAGAS
jgi:sigma-B regulation protein RsbU (phosphoserine phosphatase)